MSLPPDGAIQGWLDSPSVGDRPESFTLVVSGWACARESGREIEQVEVVADGRVLVSADVNLPRPDVARHLDGFSGAGTSGFMVGLGLIGLPSMFELEVRALRGDDHWPLAAIRGTRRPLRTEYEPTFRPLMVTSLGRTGTTLLMRLLSAHPEVVVYESYPYEIRSATYWMQAMRVLAEPGTFFHDQTWMPYFNGRATVVRGDPFLCPPMVENEEVVRWATGEHVRGLAAFCRRSIDDFYRQVALAQDVPHARVFAEKQFPSRLADVLAEIDKSALELVSVRDPRDMLCSLLSTGWWTGFFGEADLNSLVSGLGADLELVLQGWKRRRERALLVRYEDLVAQPEKILGSALTFAGLDSSPRIVRRMVEHGFAEIPELREHRTSKSLEASLGRWQDELEPAVQELCVERFSEAMAEFGYERSPAPAR